MARLRSRWAASAFALAAVSAQLRAANGAACTSAQLACVATRQAELDALVASETPTGDVCLAHADAYAVLASCVGREGCEGADLTPAKDACLAANLSAALCAVQCDAIAASLNAQGYDEPAEAHAFAPAVVVETSANATNGTNATAPATPVTTTPALTFGARKSAAALQSDEDGGAPGANWQVLWTAPGALDADSASAPQPAQTADGFLLSTRPGEGLVSALAGDGSVVWEFEAEGSVDSAPVTGSGGDVVLGDSRGFMYQLDGASGAELQRWQLGGAVQASAALAKDYVFVVSRGAVGVPSTLHKLPLAAEPAPVNETEAAPPRMFWRRPVCAHDPLTLDWVAQALTLTDDGAVLVACQWQGFLDAYEASSGALRWSVGPIASASNRSAATPALLGAPVVDSAGNVFVAFPGGGLLRASSSSGAAADAGVPGTFPADVPGVMALDEAAQLGYALDSSGSLHAFSLSDGALQQSRAALLPPNPAAPGPALDAEGRVVVAGGQELVVLSGVLLEEVSRVDLGARVTSPVAITGGAAAVATTASALVHVGTRESPVTAPPTVSPPPSTSAPTSSKGVEQDDGHSHGWPAAAVAVVAVLAVLDLLLLLLIVYFVARDKDAAAAAEDERKRGFDGSGSGSGDFGAHDVPVGEPETPSSPAGAKPTQSLAKQ